MLKQDSWGAYYEGPDPEEVPTMLVRDAKTGLYSAVPIDPVEPVEASEPEPEVELSMKPQAVYMRKKREEARRAKEKK